MSLFVALHQHDAETCPAGDPQMGPMLLQHVSRDNAASMGVNIRAGMSTSIAADSQRSG